MEYFWRENKKFVVMLAAGIVVFFGYKWFVLDGLNGAADKAVRELQLERNALAAKMAAGVPDEDSVAEAGRVLEQSKTKLVQLTADTAFDLDKRFQKPKGERAIRHFEDLSLDLYKELQKKAVNSQVSFPRDFGMDGDATEESAGEMLLRLAMIDRLVNVGVKSKIAAITHIDGLYRGDGMDRALFVKGQFLNKVSVFMRFTGPSEAVHKLLHGVQKKGDYLAISHYEARKADPTEDRLDAAIGVSLLVVDPEAPIEAAPVSEFEDD